MSSFTKPCNNPHSEFRRKRKICFSKLSEENLKMSNSRTKSQELSPKTLVTQSYHAPMLLKSEVLLPMQLQDQTLYFSISLIILKHFGTRLMQNFCWQLKVYLKAEELLSDKVEKLSPMISALEFSATQNVI